MLVSTGDVFGLDNEGALFLALLISIPFQGKESLRSDIMGLPIATFRS